MLFGNTSSRSISNLVLYPRSGFGGETFVLGSIRFNQESIYSRFLHIVLIQLTRPYYHLCHQEQSGVSHQMRQKGLTSVTIG